VSQVVGALELSRTGSLN